MIISKDNLDRNLSSTDRKALFQRLGFEINGEKPTGEGWLNNILGPKELGEGSHGNFAVNIETAVSKITEARGIAVTSTT